MATIKLADYLFTRLRQLGVESVHGVPGDYNLELLDYVEPAGLQWVGNANELNAAYAADGYGRIKGISAVVTTFGVGELSAINAIAGAYTEFSPIVHIVGVPSRTAQDTRAHVHHTFNDGEYGRFAQMHAHVTAAQTRLYDPQTSAEQIDSVLQQCLIHHRPVYLQVPVDLVAVPLSTERLAIPITLPPLLPSVAATADVIAKRILDAIYAAKQPYVLIDGEIRPLGIVEEVQTFLDIVQWPTFVTPFGKGLVAEGRPYFHGIEKGKFGEVSVQNFITNADLVLDFGPHNSSTNTFYHTSTPKADVTISFTPQGTQFRTEPEIVRDVPVKAVLKSLLKEIDAKRSSSVYSNAYPAGLARDQIVSVNELPAPDSIITQDKLWRFAAHFLREDDIVMGETGTAGYGVREMLLPARARFFTPVTWLSIGYMLPAAQGAALAKLEQQKLGAQESGARTILFIGDGSFQMTAQELSTIIRLNLNVIVFLVNNNGYTIERCIHGRKQGYNDVANWRYLEAPSFFGADKDAFVSSARTWGELQAVLQDDRLVNGKGLRMVEIHLEVEDAPLGNLRHLLEMQKGRE
ncbi:pyruvate decarboxylase [Ophiostoma piceae UAMH 11346]|uniref:Pyruvate decarboxylase n=1 Tax=Ophiostoma piceae (strain UAMH 11346) TaxID=1262450 RepID=S3CQB1_OPHP1|nr:pyruvate decarboxylase [Ophiostoma piceae UAMH 11346]